MKFYVNLSEFAAYSINKIGAYFGDVSLDTIKDGDVPLTYLNPQIESPSNFFPLDTIGWTLITGTFTATGNEKYMVIGNFRSDAATDTLPNNLTPTSRQYSACTIALDDVSCIPIDLPAYAGPDRHFLPGEKIYLGRERDVGIDEDCMWYKWPNMSTVIDTAAGIFVSPAQTSTYIVRQEICGMVKWDTVVVYQDYVGLAKIAAIENSIRLYPQPGRQEITISAEGFELPGIFDRYIIYDDLLREIKCEPVVSSDRDLKVDVSMLPPGLYTLRLLDERGGGAVARRMLVQK